MSTFLGLMVLPGAATSPASENNLWCLHVATSHMCHQNASRELSIASELQGTKYRLQGISTGGVGIVSPTSSTDRCAKDWFWGSC